MAGLYIHIPFCHSKCSYCDFFSTPDRRRVDELLDTLVREFEMRRGEIEEDFETVYIGGGTPSIIPAEKLQRLCSRLPVGRVKEFTIEVNPEDVDTEAVSAWREIGVNRVSMGIQSFDDQELAAINRRHDSRRATEAIECLRRCGIENISCDLIYGLPGQNLNSWQNSLEKLLSYKLPHMSAYCLSYEPGTALYARMTAGKITPTDDETLERMYGMLCAKTAEAGYEHYEISNFALQGMRSRHNSSYWTSSPYLGLGPGAHSFDGRVRRYNPSNLRAYIDGFPATVIDEENETERLNDKLITALRTDDGLDLNELTQAQARRLQEKTQVFIADGSMSLTPAGRLRISERAWFTSDAILRELIEV